MQKAINYKNKHFVLTSVFFILMMIFFGGGLAKAAVPGQGLTLSPPVSELTIKPGQTITQTIRVTNPTDKLVEVFPQAMDFKAKGESGQPSFYLSSDSSGSYSLASWVKFSSSELALTPQQVVDFKYTIVAPKNAESGGHYGTVFFVSNPPSDSKTGSKVSVGSMLGSLVLATVPGNISEKASLASFLPDQKVHFNNKVTFDTTVQNQGNIHFVPTGKIVIYNLTGKIVGQTAFNGAGGNVLPASSRKFEDTWSSGKFLLGRYKAKLNLTYGSQNIPLSASLTFWVVPVWSLVVLLIIILIICFVLKYLISRKKGRRRLKKSISKVMPPAKTAEPKESSDHNDQEKPRIILR